MQVVRRGSSPFLERNGSCYGIACRICLWKTFGCRLVPAMSLPLLFLWLPLALAGVPILGLFLYWARERVRYHGKLDAVPIRVHVNGTRGKSTVTRMVAGALREAGMRTVAKTTGSEARVVDEEGEDWEIVRHAAATLLEEREVLETAWSPGLEAVVVECMAVRPDLQEADARLFVRPTLSLLTNVRLDHQEQMGWTLPAIARSLARGFPWEGRVFTAESSEEVLAVLQEEANARGASLEAVPEDFLHEEEWEEADPFAFRANVALSLAAALAIGVERAVALRGILRAAPDPGAAKGYRAEFRDRPLACVDLFAVNDLPSARENIARARAWAGEEVAWVVLLNNRQDRQERVRPFARFVAEEVPCERVALLGAYVDTAANELRSAGVRADRILRIGEGVGRSVDSVLEQITAGLSGGAVGLLGLVNRHTAIADRLRARLEPAAYPGSPEGREVA